MKQVYDASLPIRVAVAVALAAIAVASANGFLQRPAVALGGHRIAEPAREYLNAACERSVQFLVGLSAAKSGLAIIEGSTANVSFGVGVSIQVGDIVKALYDAVDYAWTAVLLGCAILFALRQLLDAGFYVGQYTFALALVTWATLITAGASMARSSTTVAALRRLLSFSATTTLVLWLCLPVSFLLAAATSAAVTAPQLKAAQQEVQSLNRVASITGPSASGVRDTLEGIRTYLVTKADDVTGALGTIIGAYVLDCVVFPVAFAVVIFGGVKRLAGVA